MAYKTIMDNLLAEFRAVQKIQAQDAQVIKQLSNEEKARLSLVQKLIKAYLAREPEEVVLGLLGGNGLAVQVGTNSPMQLNTFRERWEVLRARWLQIPNLRANQFISNQDVVRELEQARTMLTALKQLEQAVLRFQAEQLAAFPEPSNAPVSALEIENLLSEIRGRWSSDTQFVINSIWLDFERRAQTHYVRDFRLENIDGRINAIRELGSSLDRLGAFISQILESSPEFTSPVTNQQISAMRNQGLVFQAFYERLKGLNTATKNALEATQNTLNARLNTLSADRAEGETDAAFAERGNQRQVLETFETQLNEALLSVPLRIDTLPNATNNEVLLFEGNPRIITVDTTPAMRGHELQHYIQYCNGRLAFIVADRIFWKPLYDIGDEVEAYRVQFTIDPRTLPLGANGRRPSTLAEITRDYVYDIRVGGVRYRDRVTETNFNLSMETPAQDVLAATPRQGLAQSLAARAVGANPLLDYDTVRQALVNLINTERPTMRVLLERIHEFVATDGSIVRVNFRDYISFR